MKIAAMAAGAVGAYFGGRMQAAGHDVAYIARRAHLAAFTRSRRGEAAPLGAPFVVSFLFAASS